MNDEPKGTFTCLQFIGMIALAISVIGIVLYGLYRIIRTCFVGTASTKRFSRYMILALFVIPMVAAIGVAIATTLLGTDGHQQTMIIQATSITLVYSIAGIWLAGYWHLIEKARNTGEMPPSSYPILRKIKLERIMRILAMTVFPLMIALFLYAIFHGNA